MPKKTGKTDAAATAKNVTVTKSTPLTVVSADGATITLVRPTKDMPIPELLSNAAPAAAEFNLLVKTVLDSGERANTLFNDYIFPSIEIFRAWHDSFTGKKGAKERKAACPECNTIGQFKKALGVSDSLDRMRNYRAKRTLYVEGMKLLEAPAPQPPTNDKDNDPVPADSTPEGIAAKAAAAAEAAAAAGAAYAAQKPTPPAAPQPPTTPMAATPAATEAAEAASTPEVVKKVAADKEFVLLAAELAQLILDIKGLPTVKLFDYMVSLAKDINDRISVNGTAAFDPAPIIADPTAVSATGTAAASDEVIVDGSVFTGELVTDRIGVESVGQDKSEAAAA